MSQQVKVTRELQVGQQSVANRAKISDFILYTVNTAPGNIANTASSTVTFAATGVALGDVVLPICPADLKDIAVTGYVQAANAIELVFTNSTATANVLFAAADWKCLVIKAT